MPNNNKEDNEAAKIYDEVERKKKKAWEAKIPQLVTNLYFEHIKYYPTYIKHNRDWVCSLITDAVKLNENTTKITLNNNDYLFTLIDEGIFEHSVFERLVLFFNNKKLLELTLSVEVDYDIYRRPLDIKAFVEGEWINDLKTLEQKINLEKEERKRRDREEPNKINKLKKDFGIE
jgi:hypothetical protein